ncbi:MAG: hypothetical protein CMO16_03390 [Thaumarchaeota archaeon]|nr:hypothetical protein [Nitrososphaerota archaeon]|tara:strand:- start:1207 stop:2220 length:1014 start_codon:yes stop_codon:yes gene_type:complete
MPRQQFIRKTPKEFLERAFSYGKSENTRIAKQIALKRFNTYLKEKHKRDIDNIPKKDPIELLDGYVIWLNHNDLSKRSIKNYVSTAKQWLRFNKIKIDSEEFRDQVRIGRAEFHLKQALDRETLVKILRMIRHSKYSVVSYLLASTGARPQEIFSLKYGDIDLKKNPAQIKFRAATTKIRHARLCFLTKECETLLRVWLASSPYKEFVFTKDKTRSSYKLYLDYFNYNVDKLDISQIMPNGQRDITIYSFRQYFRTLASHVIDRDFAEDYIGHTFYLSQYHNLPIEEKIKMFRKLEPQITFSENILPREYIPTIQDQKISELEKELEEIKKAIRKTS